MKTKLIAVYGTLKQGFGNNRLLQDGGFEFVGNAVSVDAVFDMGGGGYPVVKYTPEEPDDFAVEVELWSYTDPVQIGPVDRLEGYPGWYDKQEFDFVTDDGTRYVADMYVMSHLNHHPRDHSTITRNNGAVRWN